MFDGALDFILAGLLLAVSIPLLVLGALYRKVRSTLLAALRGAMRQPPPLPSPLTEIAGQFAFTRAIEAHEALIDAIIHAGPGSRLP